MRDERQGVGGGQAGRGWGWLAGFTLLELMVSMAVFALVAVLLAQILVQAQGVARQVSARASQFREAGMALEAMSLRLGQATLGTYWDYRYEESGGRKIPVGYVPKSELRLVVGQGRELLADGGLPAAHAVFFAVPLGFSEVGGYRDFSGLLNAWGYYLEYGDGARFEPAFLGDEGVGWATRRRYRLIEYRQPSERLAIYRLGAGDDSWFRDKELRYCRPVAENIVAMVVRPMESRADVRRRNGQMGSDDEEWSLAPGYGYDSASEAMAPGWRHQLPPLVQLTLVAIDEASAVRLEELGLGGELVDPAWFTRSGEYDQDLKRLEGHLTELGLDYRVMVTTVALRAARWVPRAGMAGGVGG